MGKFDLLLFDLGGVFVHWDGITPLLKHSRKKLTAEDARRFWLESPWVRKFETGSCSPEAFARGVIEELDFDMAVEEFVPEFISWDRGPLPGAVALLEELSSIEDLGCLSNNNELHWNRLKEDRGFERFFKHCYISHEIGLIKPDREIFDYVCADSGYRPEQILFMDDNPECVEGARRVGLEACQVQGPEQVRSALERFGILG